MLSSAAAAWDQSGTGTTSPPAREARAGMIELAE